jgi:hypothetical protein
MSSENQETLKERVKEEEDKRSRKRAHEEKRTKRSGVRKSSRHAPASC